MVMGFERFKDWFAGYEEQFVIIGGAACDMLMGEAGLDFRATKDIDMVLIVEALTPDFGRRFWEFAQAGGYALKNKSSDEPQFYRFTDPDQPDFPYMIELFSRRVDSITLPADAHLTPMPLDDDLSSLSAILLDNDYYNLLRTGRVMVDGLPILDAAHLIPFKAKAWLDLSTRRAVGESVDSRHILKHKNDVFRLSRLLTADLTIDVSNTVKADLTAFGAAMENEDVDLRAFGIRESKAGVLERIMRVYFSE